MSLLDFEAVAATGDLVFERWMRSSLLELCAVDSTTGREDRLLPVLRSHLESLGASIQILPVDGVRANVLAYWSPPEEVKVLLSTHLDTVPPYLPPVAMAGGLRGRGTCDAKGQIVAQLGAIKGLLNGGERRVAWLGVVGEETDSLGAEVARDLAPELAGLVAVINGEPTENRLPRGQKGFLHLDFSCRGRRAHGGDAQAADSRQGQNALWRLHDWLEALREVSGSDPDFGPEVWNLGLVRGGEAANVVAGSASAEVVVRTVPGSDFLRQADLLAPAGGAIRVLANDPPFHFGEVDSRAMAPAVGFGSDAPRLAGLLAGGEHEGRVFMVGPGNIDDAHTDDEQLSWRQLRHGVDAIRDLSQLLILQADGAVS